MNCIRRHDKKEWDAFVRKISVGQVQHQEIINQLIIADDYLGAILFYYSDFDIDRLKIHINDLFEQNKDLLKSSLGDKEKSKGLTLKGVFNINLKVG